MTTPTSKQQEEALYCLITMNSGGIERVKNAIDYKQEPAFVPAYDVVMNALKSEFSGHQGQTMDYSDGSHGHADASPDPKITVWVNESVMEEGTTYSGVALYAIFVRMLNLTHQPTLF